MTKQRMRIAVRREIPDNDPITIDIHYPIDISYQVFVAEVKAAINTLILATQNGWEEINDD